MMRFEQEQARLEEEYNMLEEAYTKQEELTQKHTNKLADIEDELKLVEVIEEHILLNS